MSLHGESITLLSRVQDGADAFNTPVWRTESETVTDVLVAPGGQSNSSDGLRPDGVTVAFTLCFPRAWAYRSLKGASVLIDGRAYRVIGDPRPLDGGLTPTRWNMQVEVKAEEG